MGIQSIKLTLRDNQCNHVIQLDKIPTEAECQEHAEEWVADGTWDDDYLVDVWYEVETTDEDGDTETVSSGYLAVQVEADHSAKIRAAAKSREICGDSPEDHEWESTVEVDGGLKENPGVFSLGGTIWLTCDHCVKCGLRRKHTAYGCQRNPGQCDKTEYQFGEEEQ